MPKKRIDRIKKMSNNNKRNKPTAESNSENKRKKQCTHIDVTHAYLSLNL
jgi:hypothetical protein